MAKVLLRIYYEIERMGFVSMKVIKKIRWLKMVKKLNELKESKYTIVSSSTCIKCAVITGDNYTASDLLEHIECEEDRTKIKAFETLFGTTFYSDCNFIKEIIDAVKQLD